VKLTRDRPYADPEVAARKLSDRQFGRTLPGRPLFIELINGPFLFELKATPTEYTAGLNL
jgi:hypothetical protein